MTRQSYVDAILAAHHYLLKTYPNVFVFGQGLWSPWYVGASMRDLDKIYGVSRVIDSPVSEVAVTGAAIGAAMYGYRPIVVHPRMDFMILAIDQIVTQAAKWSHMFGGQTHAPITVRGIVNRGGEQGAQHSQALHAWFAHIPGLRVVMPATPLDARELFIASVLSDDPVLYIDDRWLYELEDDLPPITEWDLHMQHPKRLRQGGDCTLVGCSYTTKLCLDAATQLEEQGVRCDVIDLRVLNPLNFDTLVESVSTTGRLVVADGGWRTCGIAGEVIAGVLERIPPHALKSSPVRLTLPDAPAPTSHALEAIYYLRTSDLVTAVQTTMQREKPS